jgi:lipoic acid synthetase
MTLPRPDWLRKRLPLNAVTMSVEAGLMDRKLHTICQEGCCPNQGECFAKGIATFLILGNVCTRNCRFCAVHHGKPFAPDRAEPGQIALEILELGLRFAVITSVTRDDLPDGGASHFALVIRAIRKECLGIGVEVLVPDFQGSATALKTVISAAPDVLNHNVETVPRLYPQVRPQASYRRSLDLLSKAKRLNPSLITKSGLMVGLGETAEEVLEVMADLRAADCDILTVGQYLSPSAAHLPVVEYIQPEIFEKYRMHALSLGFKAVAAAPFVRSSYMAELVFRKKNM